MAYLSLYRKWRPQAFHDAVGQEHIIRTLTNALSTGRVAHAYLFSGPRGTGKTTFARLLAKGLNCVHGPTGNPCNACENCERITRGTSVDVIEIDGASNRGIDEIRELRERVKYAPTEGRSKVYIIDEVHMLTNEAFNALLKVLEEPPPHVVFVFATTEAYKVPATILSRCQKFDFRRFTPSQLTSQLERVVASEGVQAEPQALALIARHAEGGMRDALAILDQCLTASAGQITVETVTDVLGIVRRDALEQLASHIVHGNLSAGLQFSHSLLEEGVEPRQLLKDLTVYLRDLILLKVAPDAVELVAVEGDSLRQMREQAQAASLERLLWVVEVMAGAESEVRWAVSPAMAVEILLVKAMAGTSQAAVGAAADAGALAALEKRIETLESLVRQLQAGGVQPLTVKEPQAPVAREPQPPAAREPQQRQRPAVDEPASAGGRPPGGKDEKEPAAPAAQVAQAAGHETAAGPEMPDLLARLRAKWPAVLQALKEERMISTEAFLRVGTPGAIDGRTVVIYFSPGHKFHQANIEGPRHKAVVEKAISRIMGTELNIRTEVGAPPESPRPSAKESKSSGAAQSAAQSSEPELAASKEDPQAGSGTVLQSPSVQKALQYLGGRVVKIEQVPD